VAEQHQRGAPHRVAVARAPGPQVQSWTNICAGLAAKTVARGPVVTASVDTVHFLRPCRLGSVAIVAAMVNRTFQSSMEARRPPAGAVGSCAAELLFGLWWPSGLCSTERVMSC